MILHNYLNNNKKIKMLAVHAHAEPHQNYMYMTQLKIKWAVQLRPIDFYHL